MRKFNVYKIEGGEKTLLRENATMEAAMLSINLDKEEHGYMDVYSMKPCSDVRDCDVVTYQVFDADPAFEAEVADKKLNRA